MASESRGPPRWKAPIDPTKISKAPAPPSVFEQLESITSVMPIGEPAEVVGTGVGVSRPTGKKPKVPGTEGSDEEKSARPRAAVEIPAGSMDYGALPPEFGALASRIDAVTSKRKIEVNPVAFVPSNRRAFKQFIIQAYRRYALPPPPAIPDPEACAKQAAASKTEVKSFAYYDRGDVSCRP